MYKRQIYYISVNSAEAYKNRLPVRGVYNQGVTEQGNRRIISHDVWKNAVVFETYKDREMVRITMAGTDSRDNSSTTVPYPEGSTRIEEMCIRDRNNPGPARRKCAPGNPSSAVRVMKAT